ncbi:MAG: hypothetical protein JNL10_03555 [Verrucomicrobiales bacterium]|nr:hypothetical protein [Verrucomicrobiales bacterium]
MFPHFRRGFGILSGAALLFLSARGDTPLTLGAIVSGTLDKPGAQSKYTFSAAAGQRLLFDSLNSEATQIYLTLTAPSGQPVIFWNGANVHSDIGPTTLSESGAYTLLVDGAGETIGAFSFRILDLATVPDLPLDNIATETLDPGNSVRAYRLAGTAGQRIYFDALGNNAGGAWYLYGPAANSQPIASSQIGADFETTLPTTGNHVLVLYGSSPTPVIYSFQAVSFAVNPHNLSLGPVVAGAIANPGDQEVYTFTGAPGQRILYDALDADNLQINARLISPSGITLAEWNSDSDQAPFTLNEAGSYSLVIDGIGSVTGSFRFRVYDIANLTTLAFDTVVTDTLNPGISARAYRFEGTAGQHLYLDGLGANAGGQFVLYKPDNSYLANGGIGGDFETTLPVNGRYVLVALGSNAGGPLPFSFQLITSDLLPGTLSLGSLTSGNITEIGEQHLFTFNGSAGQRIYFDAQDADGEQIYTRLVAPSGAFAWDFAHSGSDIGPVTLLENGLYTLVVDGSGAAVGDFRFRLLDLAAAAPLSVGPVTSGTLSPSTATQAYQYNGTAGQRLNFESLSATANQANWRLVGPANQVVAGSASITADLPKVLLPVTGNYVLLVEGYAESAAPLQFQFTVTNQSDVPVAVSGLGILREGAIAAGQSVTNTFTAPAGLWVYYDSQERNNATSLIAELRDPTGAVVFTYNAGSDTQSLQGYGLPRSGTYQMIIRGNSPGATGAFRYRLVDLSSGLPALVLGSTVSGTFEANYRTDIYQFAGQAGQRLLYDGLQNDFANVQARLLMPDGQFRFITGNSDQDTAPFSLPFSGTYRLLIENQTGVAATYAARIFDIAAQPLLPFETLVSLTLDPGLGNAIYRFDGSPGQRLFFNGLPTSGPGSWYLYGPANEQLGAAGFTGDFEYVTTNPGRHVLVLFGNSPSTSPVTFEVFTPGSGTPGGGLRITSLEVANGGVTVSWTSTPGQKYRLQSKPALSTLTWTDIPGDVTAAGSSASKVDPTGGGAGLRFYQVITVP